MTSFSHIASEGGSVRSIVGEEKATALNTGAVKDDKSQALSTLTEAESAAGVRKGAATAKPIHAAKRAKATGVTGTNRPSSGKASANGVLSEDAATEEATAKPRKLSIRRFGAAKVAHELDDTEEFEGAGSAYDKATLAKRAYDTAKARSKDGAGKRAGDTGKTAAEADASANKAKGNKGKHDAAPKTGRKAKGALGTAKGAANKGAGKGAAAPAAQAKSTQAAAGKIAATAGKSGALKAIGAAVSGAAAPVAGILAGVLAFIGAVLLVSQLVSAIFGFWQNEANKQAMAGLPPYITYEMVEAALECQETYRHPAGCTLAQIICESGQGDHMSQLATRDHNLFGIKWASSFAAAPEVSGKSAWQTGEEYDGQHVTITAYFTVFKSDVDCVKFRSRVFLQQSHFKNQPAIQEAIANHDSDKMTEGLKAGGWATSSTYVETLKSIMDTYGLRRFDSMSVSDWKDMDAKAQKIVAAAESQLGVPYVWGGSTPGKGLDCSGLTQYCYAQAGISIGHNTEVQAGQLTHIPISEAKPGDILYRSGHVAIYVGRDQYIHEPHSGDVCKRSTGAGSFSCALTYRIV